MLDIMQPFPHSPIMIMFCRILMWYISFLLQVDIPASSRTNHQALPSGTGIYDNDPWSSMQDESELTISLQSERNNQGIVYASLNHCVIGRNPRQENNMQEAPTEYASICVRS